MMMYRFETKISDKDYYEFHKYHFTDSPDVKKSSLLGQLYLPALFLLLFIYRIIRGDDWNSLLFALIIFSIVSVAWFFTLKPLSLLCLKIHLKFMKKNGKLPYSDYATLEFYDDYFVEITENTKTEVKYDAVFKVRVNEPKAIYIYQNAVLAYIIPCAIFSSDDERRNFIDFIMISSKKKSSI